MIIAAHCFYFQNQERNYLLNLLLALAEEKPHHHFIIFTDTEIPSIKTVKNVEGLVMQPVIKNKLSLQYWYRFKMPGILQNKGVDVFISEAGMLIKKITIPQYLFIRPENKRQSEVGKISNFAFQNPKLFSTQVSRAAGVFITEPALNIYIKNKQIPTCPVYYGLSKIYKSIGFEEKDAFTNTHTEGFDFFVFHVSETTKKQVMPMLKAFSIFKKWTESSMKLILFTHFPFSESDVPKFNLYKFRNEVVFKNFEDNAAAATLYASAFLHIYLPDTLADENFPLHALQTQTGLLTTDIEYEKERFGSAAAYCSLNEKAIAEKLLYYYKNDFEKENLIAEAAPLLKNYSLENSSVQITKVLDL